MARVGPRRHKKKMKHAEYFSYIKDFKRIYALWEFLPNMMERASDFSPSICGLMTSGKQAGS